MIAWPVGFVVVPVAAKMQQVQFVNEALLFQQVNRAVNGDEMHARVNLLRSLENLIDVQMLLGIIHYLQDDAPLPGHANSPRSRGLQEFPRCFGGIEALTSRDPVSR
jgi:hypothetical protein